MTCLWPMLEEPSPPEAWTKLDETTRERARTLASRTLERLTGFRVSVCPVTIRPCRTAHVAGCPGGSVDRGYAPLNFAGRWSNVGCSAGCGSHCELSLPGPVGRIDEVKCNGVVLAEADYQIQNENILVWIGSDPCPFPLSQRMDLADTEPGTMSITYVNAYDPGIDGIGACTRLAYEFGKDLAGENCKLPSGVSQIARQGITMTIPTGAFPEGRTGIREVDTFISLWNPHNIDPPQVWSPDAPQHRRVGG